MLKSPFLSLLKKEFISVWQDKKSRSVILLPPILQLFIFSHAATLDVKNIRVGILNEDKTEITREIIRQIETSKYFKKIYYFKNKKEMKDSMDEEKIRAALYIKNDFTKKYKAKSSPEILIITDGRRTNSGQIISSYITEILTNFTPIAEKKNELLPVSFEIRNKYNQNLSYYFFIISSLLGILPMTIVVLLSALALAREKELGTFDTLMIMPLKTEEIIFAKILVPLFFGVLDGVIVLFLAMIFFSLPFLGSFILYLLSLIVFLISISGIGLFMSCYCKTQEQAMLVVFAFMMPAVILSGYTSPIENITPKFLQYLTFLNPLRFFLVISKGIIMKNLSAFYVFMNLIPILLISFFTIGCANYAFKKNTK